MGRRTIINKLQETEKAIISKLLTSGHHSVWVINRARVLQMNDAGQSLKDISSLLEVNYVFATGVIRDYKSGGLDYALYDSPRSGAPRKITEEVEAHITSIACSEAPEGHIRWTVEMIRDELVRLEVIEQLSIGSTHTVLKKVNSSLGSTSFGVSRQ